MEKVWSSILNSSIWDFVKNNKALTIISSAAAFYGLYFFKRPPNLPPGPWGYPYIGSWLEFTGDTASDLMRLGKKYGEPCCVWMGAHKYVVIINSYEVAKEACLNSGEDFANREPVYCFGGFDVEEPLFNGAYNIEHKFCRKIITTSLRKFIATKLSEVLENEREKLFRTVDKSLGKAMFVYTPIEQLLSNCFSAIHFNRTYELDDPELKYFTEELSKWFVAFEDSFGNMLFGKTVLIQEPRSATKILSEFHAFIKKKIQEHEETIDRNNPRDVLDVYLTEGLLDRLGIDALANLVMVTIPDGVNSASVVLGWMFHHLVSYPEYHEAILKEINDLKGSEPVKVEDKQNLPLTEAFLLETMRLTPPFKISPVYNTIYPAKLCGYDIPTRSSVTINYEAILKDPELFPDPFEFKPERFIGENGKIHMTEGFVAFGLGRRICVGETIIKTVIFFVFASIVQNYNISPDPKKRAKERIGADLLFKQEDFHLVFDKK